MHIQIGSTVTINKRGQHRDGVVTGISIALRKSDPAGEQGKQVGQGKLPQRSLKIETPI